MPTEEQYLTQEKFNELGKELEYLRTTKRKEIADTLEYAKSLGDFSENQEYQEARDAQAVVEDRIKRLEAILKSAKIISSQAGSNVAIGSVIILEREGDKTKKTYTMVGSEEADASMGKISIHSPLGQAALNKSKGEKFSFQTPSGEMTYKIIDIQ